MTAVGTSAQLTHILDGESGATFPIYDKSHFGQKLWMDWDYGWPALIYPLILSGQPRHSAVRPLF